MYDLGQCLSLIFYAANSYIKRPQTTTNSPLVHTHHYLLRSCPIVWRKLLMHLVLKGSTRLNWYSSRVKRWPLHKSARLLYSLKGMLCIGIICTGNKTGDFRIYLWLRYCQKLVINLVHLYPVVLLNFASIRTNVQCENIMILSLWMIDRCSSLDRSLNFIDLVKQDSTR